MSSEKWQQFCLSLLMSEKEHMISIFGLNELNQLMHENESVDVFMHTFIHSHANCWEF